MRQENMEMVMEVNSRKKTAEDSIKELAPWVLVVAMIIGAVNVANGAMVHTSVIVVAVRKLITTIIGRTRLQETRDQLLPHRRLNCKA